VTFKKTVPPVPTTDEGQRYTRNLSQWSWGTWQHQFNFICKLSWSTSSNYGKNSLY